ncbi:unnamed protein product [Caenorhabditis brenneri]
MTFSTEELETLYEQLIGAQYYARIYQSINIVLFSFAFLINIFHCSILLRNELRASSIFFLMIVISIFEIFRSVIIIARYIYEVLMYGSQNYCYEYSSFIGILFKIVTTSLTSVIDNTVSWIVVWMALIRTLSVVFPLSSFTEQLSEKRGPTAKMVICGIVCSMLYEGYIVSPVEIALVGKDELCVPNPTRLNITLLPTQYRIENWNFKKRGQYNVIHGFLIIAKLKSILHIVLTIFLVKAVKDAAKLRKIIRKSEVDKTESTTRLIAISSMLFCISDIPELIYKIYSELFKDDIVSRMSAKHVPEVMTILTSIHSISHFFVCYFMSSQYKEAVKNVFGKGKVGTTILSAEAATGTVPNSLTV